MLRATDIGVRLTSCSWFVEVFVKNFIHDLNINFYEIKFFYRIGKETG